MSKISELELEISESDFWNNIEKANKINNELVNLKKSVENYNVLHTQIEETLSLLNILNDSDLEELKEIEEDYFEIKKKFDELEIETLFTGIYDTYNCFLEIHPGAGGTEACDWADMLLRMYTMFCEKNNYKYETIDKLKGETAGIKSVTIKIEGDHAYGYFKSEIGVHRLVRISPFNAAGKRQTSFASVSVIPEIDDKINIEINNEDIRVDVYRSSGCGGQGVNTTDSAVRITHLPTKIVVTCQNERSQIKNKEMALNILKSKLYNLELEKQNDEINNFKENKSIGWGNGKRSYVMCPYTLVKDNETNYETSAVEKVLDGEIEEFIYAGIKKI